jgi:hypothetical protein
MLYACYDLIRPDVILEISWRHGLNDFTMVSSPDGVYFCDDANTCIAIHDQLPRPAGCDY